MCVLLTIPLLNDIKVDAGFTCQQKTVDIMAPFKRWDIIEILYLNKAHLWAEVSKVCLINNEKILLLNSLCT